MGLFETIPDGSSNHLIDHAMLKAEYAERGSPQGVLPDFTLTSSKAQHAAIHNILHADYNALGGSPSLPTNLIGTETASHLAWHQQLHTAYNLREERDPLKQPFASDSIWNTPLGTGAQYVHANFEPLTTVYDYTHYFESPQIDDDIIILDPGAPLRNIETNNVGWGGGDRCTDNGATLATVPIPDGFIVPSNNENGSAAILKADGRTIYQNQPFTRCTSTGHATSLSTTSFPDVDIYDQGNSGSHGGSKLSAIGGCIRMGELRPGQVGIRHAIKIILDAEHFLYNGPTYADCWRYPATVADSAWADYGDANNNQNVANKMGALLALRPDVDIYSLGLRSDPGRQIAWTLKHYGGYVVDAQGGYNGMGLVAEKGPAGWKQDEFFSDYGWDMRKHLSAEAIATNRQPPSFGHVTPWALDMVTLWPLLHVVNNNTSTSKGGGGTPRRALAAPIAP